MTSSFASVIRLSLTSFLHGSRSLLFYSRYAARPLYVLINVSPSTTTPSLKLIMANPDRSIYDKYQRSWMFTGRGIQKHPEFWPMLAIVGIWTSGAAAYGLWALARKPDVVINKTECAPWEKVRPTETRKLYIVNPCIYRVNPQLEELRQEMGTFRPCAPCRPPKGCIEP